MCAMPVYLNNAHRFKTVTNICFLTDFEGSGLCFLYYLIAFTVAVLSGGFCKRKKLV